MQIADRRGIVDTHGERFERSPRVFGGTFYFSRASNQVRSAFAPVDPPMSQAAARFRDEARHFALRGTRVAARRKSAWPPQRTERRECVESICHGVGRVDANLARRALGKKYSHFPRSGGRRQGLGDGAREMDGDDGRAERWRTTAEAPGQRVRTRKNRLGSRNVIITAEAR